MRALKLTLAVLVGAWLYYFAVVYAGGMLAAMTVPRAYFNFFGQQNLSVALALSGLVTWALPVAVLVCSGYLAGNRLLPGLTGAFPFAVVLGMLACFTHWVSVSEGGSSSLSLVTWWGVPGLLAPWVGAALGAWLAVRSNTAKHNAGV
jgi:hypothetical protein